jgi:PAS domain S-box-containing protein
MDTHSTKAIFLHKKSEELLQMRRDKECLVSASETNPPGLIYDLAERLIELEQENDELIQAKKQSEIFATKYRTIFESIQDAYFEASLDGTLLEISPSIEIITKGQYTREEMIGEPFAGVYANPEDRNIYFSTLFRQKQVTDYELSVRNKDGSLIPVAVSAALSFDDNGKPVKITGILRNNTERKKAEEKLKQSEAALNYSQEIANMGSWEYNYITRKVTWSDNYYHLIGLKPDGKEVPNDAFNKIVHPDDLHLLGVTLREIYQKREAASIDLRLIMPDGQVKWIQNNIVPQFNGDHLVGLTGVNIDITEKKLAENEIINLNKNLELNVKERTLQLSLANETLEKDIVQLKRMEELLRESEEKYHGIFDESASAVCIFDYKKNFINANQAGIDMLGYSLEELQHMKISDVDADPDTVLLAQQELMSGGRIINYEHNLRHKDGKIVTVMNNSKPLTDGHGNVVGVLSTLIDITAYKKAEQSLKEVETRFSLFMDYLPALTFIKDSDGKMVYANNAMETALGVSKWMGLSLFEAFDRETAGRIIEDDRKTIQHGYQKIEESFTNLDGKVHHYETQKFVIPLTNQRKLIGGIAIDITGRKLVEAALISAKNEAEGANRAKSEFLSRMSHELRTPMNSILGFAQLLNMGELNPKQKKGIGYILSSGKHLLDLIDEVLDIARIESGKIVLAPEPILLSSLLAEMMDTVQPLANTWNLKLELENSSANQLFVMSDRKRLKQVLLNLLNNAVKYNREGGSITVKTEKLAVAGEGVVSARILISDTGPGIATEDIPKLFIPFERIGAEKTQTEGAGLGLAIVKKIIEAMEGSVGVESVVGRGSTFWLDLPAIENQKNWEVQQEVNSKLRASLPKTGTILYIEDNLQNAELVKEIIDIHHPEIRLTISMSGNQGIKLAQENLPDLILLDLNLPDIAGSEVLAKLQEDDRTKLIPVVVITADATPQQIEKLMTAGAKDYLTKPLDIPMFLQVVDEWV